MDNRVKDLVKRTLIKFKPSTNIKDIIKIDEFKKTVNARDLYEFLESKRYFSDWIKNRIEKYGFLEGQDFIINSCKSTLGRPSKEYHLSLDMAKELSMVEGNDRGKQARQYFIEVEKRYSSQTMSQEEIVAYLASKNVDIAKRQNLIEERVHNLETDFSNKEPVNVFPEGCIRLDNLAPKYFPGISASKVAVYLSKSNHPAKSYRFRKEDGIIREIPVYQECGLGWLYDDLMNESTLISQTSKNYIYTNPKIGRFYVNQSSCPSIYREV